MPHVYYELYYHIIWSTKNRLELIDEKIEEVLKELIFRKVNNLGGKGIEFNSYHDHCHLLSIVPPKLNLSDVIGQIKGFSSFEANKIFSEKCIQWQQGFGVLSLSRSGIPFVQEYIRNQKEHHGKNNLVKILEYFPKD